jgi:hypothetical protein
MKGFFNLRVMVVLLVLAVSCTKEEVSRTSYDSIAAQSFGFLRNAQASNEANQMRSADYSAPFEITKIERVKDLLNVTLTYPDGCSDSRFTLIWNGLVLETYPETVIFYLRRTSDCKVAGTQVSRVFTINLTQCLGDASMAQRARIILCNASKKANTENSDIPISSN